MSQKTILLADDDEDFVSVLTDLLEASGYKIESAHEGLTAVEKARDLKPDLIILDWKMPAGKAAAVIEMLSENEQTGLVPIIILSGVSEPGMEHTAELMGAKAFIRKPYETKQLLSTIKKVLGI